MKDNERYGRLSSLRHKFTTSVKDTPYTIRRLIVRPMSGDLCISTFTSHKLMIIKTLPMSLCSVHIWVPRKACDIYFFLTSFLR